MEGFNILIADNSPVYVKMFARAALEADAKATVSSATDGAGALELIRRKNYDVVVVDADIPGMELYTLLRRIIADIPKAFILVTARPSVSGDALFSEALSKGATECMTKPIYDSYIDNFAIIKRKMVEIIESAAATSAAAATQSAALTSAAAATQSAASTQSAATVFTAAAQSAAANPAATASDKNPAARVRICEGACPEIILIAASTGGPHALEVVISQLSADIPAPIMVVQHIPTHFTENLAQSLNSKSKLNVRVAQNGETVLAGNVYIAPGGTHMKLNSKKRVFLENSRPLNGVRPAADELFGSVAESFTGTGVLAVILTGMGHDGRDGLAMLKASKDCYCLVQSEKTCVVYGMPRAAAEAGYADKIMDLDKIPAEIENLCRQGRSPQ